MSRRLVKIAKELNVGTSTIVEFLTEAGFEVKNKPTAKVSDEMYDQLTERFSISIDIKEKADQLIIGSAKLPEIEKPIQRPFKSRFLQEKRELVEKKAKEKKKVVKEEIITAERPDVKVTVLGKVDLDSPTEQKQESPDGEDDLGKEKSDKADGADNGSATGKGEPAPEEMLRAETPQLQGLKVLGKIEADKLAKPKPKKEEKPAVGKSDQGTKSAEGVGLKRRRRRKRKKINVQNAPRDLKAGQPRSATRVEIKQVSQKEIEEKIRATMARITSGSKKKRQKIRRDSREDKRAKQEMAEELALGDENVLQVTEFISVSEFASLLNLAPTDIITTCMNLGVIVSINQRLDAEIIELVAEEFGKEIEFISAEDSLEEEEEMQDDEKDLEPRSPIVTVMGHVDHGKTSLLDYIRNANVAEGEAGGITQHIGAYGVAVKDSKITFLDTPGHEAFTAMRARGAKVTDVAIIIIAADDRVMPQTKEAISHAQAAGVPIVFAINKIDKPGANPEKIKEELAGMNLLVESWGGKVQSHDISAKSGDGIDELLEKVILEAEVLELKANPNRASSGTVVEASLDKGRGYVTKILVQNGSLNIGDALVAGAYSGKIKAMFNDKGKAVKSVGPSVPVLVLGLNGAPQAGEKFREVTSESEARNIATKRQQINREQSNRASKRVSLDEIGRRLALGSFKELNLIIKGDVDGSVEALSDSLLKLSIESVQVNIIHKAVGPIAESDILLASASEAIIVGFQVRPSGTARVLAEKEGIEIKTYSIIYEAIDEIKSAIEGMLDTIKEEEIVCELEVRETFKISKVGTIAGCYVNSGNITRNTFVRLIREGIVAYPNKEGAIAEIGTLKRFKDDVSEVKAGLECGLTIQNFNDIKVGDIIEGYQINEVKQKLD